MNFWDRVVFRCCLGLGEGHFEGFNRANELMQLAHRRGLLGAEKQDHLSLLSLLLLLLVCPTGTPAHEAALREHQRRRPSGRDQWSCLREALPPHLGDLHSLAHRRQPRQRALVQAAHRILLIPELVAFLSRIALVEDYVAQAFAEGALARVFPVVEPGLPRAHAPAMLQEGVTVELYNSFLDPDAQDPWPIAQEWPRPRPNWAGSSSDEVRFVDLCRRRLVWESRCVLYLSFFGQLNVRTILLLFQRSGYRGCTPDYVVGELAGAWRLALNGL